MHVDNGVGVDCGVEMGSRVGRAGESSREKVKQL